MIRVLIIGWYGTETIGDRAILAGILHSINRHFSSDIQLTLGSLYPYISERTIYEDRQLYEMLSPKVVGIEIVDTRDLLVLQSAISSSDIVLMGGGPLMDLQELWMVNYAFSFAKQKGIPTAIAGCGVGPIRNPKLQKCLAKIISNSVLVILRDEKSAEAASKIYQAKYSKPKQFIAAIDPAVTCVSAYKSFAPDVLKSDTLVASLRHFPSEYLLPGKSLAQVEAYIFQVLSQFVKNNNISSIHFVPMCYHHLGVDDRYYMKILKDNLPNLDCVIQKKPLNLAETMQLFMVSRLAIGMRFHSVVLQTLLAESNIIFDYTGGVGGKISNFVADIAPNGEMRHSILDLQKTDTTECATITPSTFKPNEENLRKKISVYAKLAEILR